MRPLGTAVPSDRRSLGHLVPFIVAVPLLGPILSTSVHLAGAAEVTSAIVGVVGSWTALVCLVGVVMRDHRNLTTQIETGDSQLVTILDGLPIAVMLRAGDGTLLHINPGGKRFVERLGVDVSHVSGGPRGMLDHVEVIDEDGRKCVADDLPVVSAMRDAASHDATLGYALPGGGFAWYAVRAAPVPLGDGSTGTVVTCDDVTERHEARNLVERAERSLRRTFDNAPIGIAVLGLDGRILQINAALCDLLGYDEAYLLAVGLQAADHPDDGEDDWQQLAERLAATDERCLIERRFQHSSGRSVFTQLSLAVVRGDDGAPLHLIAQVVDLSERRALEQELRDAALKDPLTALSNRRALAEHLAEAQRRQVRGDKQIGLLYLDLDNFKAVNDTYGHDVGDRVLIETGRRLVAETREVDTVCRMGGDEFVVLCAPIDGSTGLGELAGRLSSMPPLTVLVEGVPVEVTPSVGSVIVGADEDLDTALRRADAVMYLSKRSRTAASVRPVG